MSAAPLISVYSSLSLFFFPLTRHLTPFLFLLLVLFHLHLHHHHHHHHHHHLLLFLPNLSLFILLPHRSFYFSLPRTYRHLKITASHGCDDFDGCDGRGDCNSCSSCDGRGGCNGCRSCDGCDCYCREGRLTPHSFHLWCLRLLCFCSNWVQATMYGLELT